MSSTHADAARDALIAAAAIAFQATTQAGKDYAAAHKALATADDVVPALQAMVTAILAAEHLHDAVELAVKDLRSVLMQQLDAIGIPKVQTADKLVTAYLSKRPSFVSIDDEKRVPREFFVQKPPEIDKRALKEALKNGDVPGASLRIPNEAVLNLRSI